MENKFHSVTITIYNREVAFHEVNALLHNYATNIQSRLGHPIPDKNVAVIFLIMKMTTDDLGALTGKLGQLPDVNVKAYTLKI